MVEACTRWWVRQPLHSWGAYIAMEGKKAFTGLRILADEQTDIFTTFMTTVSAEDRSKYAAEYRKVRRSKSKKKQLLETLVARTRKSKAAQSEPLPVAEPVADDPPVG